MPELFYLIFGIILVILGVIWVLSSLFHDFSCSKKVVAKIIRTERDSKSYWRGSYKYYPVFSYTVEGKNYIIKDKYSQTRNKNKYFVGKEAVLSYNPKSPEEFRNGIKLSMYFIGASIFLLGAFFSVLYFI